MPGTAIKGRGTLFNYLVSRTRNGDVGRFVRLFFSFGIFKVSWTFQKTHPNMLKMLIIR